MVEKVQGLADSNACTSEVQSSSDFQARKYIYSSLNLISVGAINQIRIMKDKEMTVFCKSSFPFLR